jgi:hypothetical protein
VRGIAEQRKIQLLLGLEVGEEFRRIGTGAENGDSCLIKLRACVAKLGRFDRSTRGVRLRKEKQEDALALEILQRDFFVFVGFQAECGRFCT